MSVPRILFADPGKRTGIALINDELNGTIVVNKIMLFDELVDWAETLDNLSVVGFEDYIIGPKGNQGSRGDAIQVIGYLKSFARRRNVKVVAQAPEKRLIAAKWAGERIPRGHMPDDQSARLHAIFYLRQQGKFTTKLERERWKNA